MRVLLCWVVLLGSMADPSLEREPSSEMTITVGQQEWRPTIRWRGLPGHGLVQVNDEVAGTLTLPNGSLLSVRRTAGQWFGREQARLAECTVSGNLAISSTHGPATSWESLEAAEEEAANDMLESPEQSHPRPPLPLYEATLTPASLLLVLDKLATGPDTEENLAAVTAAQLAMVAQVAANYERQLGIQLELQELILTPDSEEHEDIPHADALNDFRAWVSEHRPTAEHGWSMASKRGAGLSGTTLGKAFIAQLGRDTGVSVVRTDAPWTTLAHELGHTLGAIHARGGLMNASSSSDRSESFFTDVSASKTAAMQIFERAKDWLPSEIPLRHPEEMPFAEHDSLEIAKEEAPALDLLQNDLLQVRHGQLNKTLTITEISALVPPEAGTLTLREGNVFFEPNVTNVASQAWFRYAIQGDVGNDGAGWMHAGEVTLTWMPDQTGPKELPTLTLTPSEGGLRLEVLGQLPPNGQVEVSDDLTPNSWRPLPPEQAGGQSWWLDPAHSPAAYYRLRHSQEP